MYGSAHPLGFTPKKSTVDRILAVRVLSEQMQEFSKGFLVAYIDFHKTFDSERMAGIPQIDKDCVSRLQLPPVNQKRTEMILQEWHELELTENQDQTLLTVCAIFSAVIEYRTEMASPSEQGPSCTLMDILRAGGIKLKPFLVCMRYIGKKYQHSGTMEGTLSSITRKYVITIGIYKTFTRLMGDIFEAPEHEKDLSSNHDRRRVCWCLFLVAKAKMLPENSELISPLQLMLCCLDYIVKQTPLFMLKEPFRTAQSTDRSHGSDHLSVLREINTACASEPGVNVDELLSAQANLFHPFLEELPKEVLDQTADGLPELAYFQRKYKSTYEQAADIDEMAFLENDKILMPVLECPQSPDTTNNEMTLPVPQTPVRNCIRSVQSLKTLLAGTADKPSDSLCALLNEYGADLVRTMSARVEQLRAVFIQKFIEVRGQPLKVNAQTKFRLGVRLYYREMEHFLTKERERHVEKPTLVTLLKGDLFHRCLLACSLEVVKVTYEYVASPGQESFISNGGLDFPWILKIFQLYSYDFCRVIETFIREESQLPEQALRHLKNAEEFILESEAWKAGSPFLGALRSRPILTDSQQTSEEAITASPSRRYTSPSCSSTGEATPPPRQHPSPPVVSRQMGYSPGPPVVVSSMSGLRRDLFLEKFLMKVQQLGYKRLLLLCKALEIPGDLERRVWTCLDHCLMNRPDLLENHHLDQILMCCIFAVCIVSNRSHQIKFKQIADVYKTLPHAVPSTYKQVWISPDRSDHIIRFYNSVFINALKDYILRFQPHSTESPRISPVPSRSPSTPTHQRPYRVHPSVNLTVSPMRASPFKSPGPQRYGASPVPPHTPRTALLLYTGDYGNSQRLQQFNRSYGSESKKRGGDRARSPGARKALKMEDTTPPRSDDNGNVPHPTSLAEPSQNRARSIIKNDLECSTPGSDAPPGRGISNGHHRGEGDQA